MASCGTSDSALSEMDSSSITMTGVISSENVFKEVQQLLSRMTDGTLKCEDLSYSPTFTELQSKLTAWEKELQSHRKSRLWLQYCIVMGGGGGGGSYIYWKVCNHILQQQAKAISLFLVEMMWMKKEELENWTKLAKIHVIIHVINAHSQCHPKQKH